MKTALALMTAVLCAVAVGAGAISMAALLEARWLLELQQTVSVGMQEKQVVARLGPPDATGAAGDSSGAWRRGFTGSDREVEHHVLTWVLFSPLHRACRLYVYVSPAGSVVCCFLGTT